MARVSIVAVPHTGATWTTESHASQILDVVPIFKFLCRACAEARPHSHKLWARMNKTWQFRPRTSPIQACNICGFSNPALGHEYHSRITRSCQRELGTQPPFSQNQRDRNGPARRPSNYFRHPRTTIIAVRWEIQVARVEVLEGLAVF
ncbi:hypothetical protein CDEST_05053 [Colletotrichum destructivum]|uniref:Uncharacterized protein n=1 Tax=Colletotrichum destructivum TaxID=34406 RepID=A0AAX4I9R7_9PEZI|nr:hypothetical protein CDEST_05053 [Colletotrichum destructivum]